MNQMASGDAGWPQADLRLVPLAAAAWAGGWWAVSGGGIGGWKAPVLGAVVLVTVLVGRRRERRLLAAGTAVCAVAAAVVGWAGVHRLAVSQTGRLAADGAAVTMDVRTREDARLLAATGTRPGLALVRAATVSVTGRGQATTETVPVLIRGSGDLALQLAQAPPGATVRLAGVLRPAEPGQDIAGVLTLRGPPIEVARPGVIDRAVNRLRAGLRDAMRWSPARQAGLVPSLVVGDTSRLDTALADDFKATGLTHVTAVSGTNLSLTLAFVLLAGRWAGVRGRALHILGVATTVAFVVVCRAEPSVLRAAAMGLVTLAAVGRSGPGRAGLRPLAAAVLALLLVDPWLARSVGFALSVCATAGIVWWSPRWLAAMRAWAPSWLGESLCVPLAAQLATQPLVTAISGNVSLVGIFANAAVGPFVGPATVLGLLAAAVSTVSGPLAAAVGWLAGWCVQPILVVATTMSAAPGALRAWPAEPWSLALLGIACLAIARLTILVVSGRVRTLTAVGCLVVAVWHPLPTPGWPGPWQVVFCTVGQGDATVFRIDAHSAVLIDTGPDPQAVIRCLSGLGVERLPLVVLTHFHADHIGGFDGVVHRFPVGTVVVDPLASPAWAAESVGRTARAVGASVLTAEPGAAYRVGPVVMEVVSAGGAGDAAIGGEGESPVENNSSIVMVVQTGALRVVVAGDAEPEAQIRAVATGASLQAQVLKMPHHGSARQDPEFWRLTNAVLAVASAGLRNDYGHPSAAALTMAARDGMVVRRTDLEGSIAVSLGADGLSVRTEHPARQPP